MILLAAVAINWIAVRQIQEATEDIFRENFGEKYATVSGSVEEYFLVIQALEEAGEPDESLYVAEQEFIADLDELAEDLDVTIRLLDLSGEFILYDTAVKESDLKIDLTDDVYQLIELEEPFEGELEDFDEFVGTDYVFSLEDEAEFILRVTETGSSSIDSSRPQILALISATLIIGIIIILGLGGWLARAITQPLTQLRQSAQAMASGKLDTRADNNAPQEVRLLADDFNIMATAVEQMMAEQRAFASNAAHELRTPLTTIRLRTETLLEDDPDEALQTRYINEIQDEVKRLGRLVDDLRILSRADAHRLETGQEWIDLAHVFSSLKREFTPTLNEKNLALILDLPDPPYVVQASINHIRTVLRNIIENGVKYTPEGGKIAVKATKINQMIQVEVEDNGIGIASDDLPQLFSRFFRADKAHSRRIAGSGLGLSLVQSIVTQYGGEIEIKSDGLGLGTTVFIRWPQTKNQNQP